MSKLIQESFFWRCLTALLRWLQEGFLGRLFRGAGRLWRSSGSYRLLIRLFCAPTAVEDSLYGRGLAAWNRGLRNCTAALRAKWQQSATCSLYHGGYRKIRESFFLGKLFGNGTTCLLLLLIAAFAIVDYLLRDVLGMEKIASVWDELLILAGFCWILLRQIAAPKDLKSRANTMDLFLGFYLLVGLLLLWCTRSNLGVNITGYRASMQYILIFFLVTRLLRNEGDFLLMYRTMLLIATVLALHGIWQFVIGVEIPDHWTDAAEGSVRTRIFSIFSNPNIMGAYMVLFAPMSIGMAYGTKKPREKILFWFCGLCMCAACLFTMSRGAWLALAVAALLFALLVDRKLLAIMVVGGVCACFLPFVRSRIGYLFTPQFAESNARGGRAKRWELGLRYLDTYGNWSVGLGYGIYGGAVAVQNPINPKFDYMYVDNYYVKTLVENGILGLSALGTSMLALFYNGLRACGRTAGTGYKPMCAGMLAGMVGILVQSVFESLWEEPYMMALFFAVAGMMVFAGFFLLPKKTKVQQ